MGRSITKVGYHGPDKTIAEVLLIQTLFKELGISDGPSAIYCYNLVLHTRTKHMEIDIFFILEKVLPKCLFVQHISVQVLYVFCLFWGKIKVVALPVNDHPP